MTLKAFTGSYFDPHNYDAMSNSEIAITANTKTEALGMALEHLDGSTAEYWDICEIDITRAGVEMMHEIST